MPLKSKKEIRDKTLQVMDRFLKESRKELFSRKVENCSRSEQIKGCSSGYYCKYQALCGDGVQLCDNDRVSRCEEFHCKNTSETIKEDFNKIIRNTALCGEKFPKLAALLWVLGGDLTDKETKEINQKKRFSIKEWIKKWLKPTIA